MLGFIKKCFFTARTFFSYNALNVNVFQSIIKTANKITNNQFNANEPMLYPYSITITSAKAIIILLMTHMPSYVFLILLKT